MDRLIQRNQEKIQKGFQGVTEYATPKYDFLA